MSNVTKLNCIEPNETGQLTLRVANGIFTLPELNHVFGLLSPSPPPQSQQAAAAAAPAVDADFGRGLAESQNLYEKYGRNMPCVWKQPCDHSYETETRQMRASDETFTVVSICTKCKHQKTI